MEHVRNTITGKRIYNLDFLVDFLDTKILQLDMIRTDQHEQNIFGAIKHIVIQKKRFNNKVDSLTK